MKTETIENIFNFIQNNEGKEIPERLLYSIKQLKFIEELENHPDSSQYRYEGNLNLSYSNITKLPNDLYVVGWLNLGFCKQLTKLPDNLYVRTVIYLKGCTQLTKLPDNLYLGGNLYLEQTNIEEIPTNLYVGGDLYINNTPLERKYTNKQIREIVTSTGGQIIGDIIKL